MTSGQSTVWCQSQSHTWESHGYPKWKSVMESVSSSSKSLIAKLSWHWQEKDLNFARRRSHTSWILRPMMPLSNSGMMPAPRHISRWWRMQLLQPGTNGSKGSHVPQMITGIQSVRQSISCFQKSVVVKKSLAHRRCHVVETYVWNKFCDYCTICLAM